MFMVFPASCEYLDDRLTPMAASRKSGLVDEPEVWWSEVKVRGAQI
jgi:hypothetical protein